MECDGGGAVNWRDVERGSGGLDGEVDIFGSSARSAGADVDCAVGVVREGEIAIEFRSDVSGNGGVDAWVFDEDVKSPAEVLADGALGFAVAMDDRGLGVAGDNLVDVVLIGLEVLVD